MRTFTIWAVLGCATPLISERFGAAVFSVALAGLCIFFTAARLRVRPEQAEGYTTFAVMIKTFFLGALVYIGERNIAVMLAAGTMVLREVGVAARGLAADADLAPALAAGADDLRNHRLRGVVSRREHPPCVRRNADFRACFSTGNEGHQGSLLAWTRRGFRRDHRHPFKISRSSFP